MKKQKYIREPHIDEVMSVLEAAVFLKVSTPTIRRLIKNGRLKSINTEPNKKGACVRVKKRIIKTF